MITDTIKELQTRLQTLQDENLILLHQIERKHEQKIKEIQLQKETALNEWKQRVQIALINNDYETETQDEN